MFLLSAKDVMTFRGGFLVTVLAAATLLFFSPATAQEANSPALEIAPSNPAFTAYDNTLKEPAIILTTESGRSLGYLPPHVDLSYLKGISLSRRHATAAPASYDLRALGRVTPVRDQGSCGACWAFAAYGALESTLLPSETRDFSENSLKDSNGFDFDPCAGGNSFISMAYLTRWKGPVDEADDPYNPNSAFSPAGLSALKHIQEVLIIPERSGPADNENIKQAMMTSGAIDTAIFMDEDYYNPSNYTYYYNGSQQPNHEVAIIGWDDNFDRTKFIPVPPGDGAFIAKNSWGTIWGDNGFFYISYYDTVAGTMNFGYNSAQATSNYRRVYQYDPLGWVSSVGFRQAEGWFANVFSAAASERLTAVSFYSASPDSAYEVFVYTDVSSGPTKGVLARKMSGTLALPGYHTVPIASPAAVLAGRTFSIVVKLITPRYNYPIPIEERIPGYSGRAAAGRGQSYVSTDGISWGDLTGFIPNANVCLKAFTTVSISGKVTTAGGVPIPDVQVTLSGDKADASITDVNGGYRFTGLVEGTFAVTASKTGYVFSPASKTVLLSGTDLTGQNFTGKAYSLSGTVRTVGGVPVQGVVMALSGDAAGATMTDSFGHYVFKLLSAGSYTVTPGKTGRTFSPANKTVEITDTSIKGINFSRN